MEWFTSLNQRIRAQRSNPSLHVRNRSDASSGNSPTSGPTNTYSDHHQPSLSDSAANTNNSRLSSSPEHAPPGSSLDISAPSSANLPASRRSSARISVSACCSLSLIEGSFGSKQNDAELRALFEQGPDLGPYLTRFKEIYAPSLCPELGGKGVFICTSSSTVPIRANVSTAPFDRTSTLPTDGHPHDILVAVVERLDPEINSFLSSPSSLQAIQSLIELYQHIELLCRYEADRDCVVRHSGIRRISEVITASTRLITATAADDTINDSMQMLVNLLHICIYLCRVCFDPVGRFATYVKTNGRTITAEGTRPSNSIIGRATKLDADTFTVVQTLYVLFSTLQNCHQLPWNILKTRVIETLGSLIAADPAVTKRPLVEREVVIELLGCIGWPSWLSSTSDPEASMLTSEFRNQLLAWNLVHFLSRTNPACRDRVNASGGYSRITGLVSWTSYCCSELGPSFKSDTVDYEGFEDVMKVNDAAANDPPNSDSPTPDYEKDYLKLRNGLAETPPEYLPHALQPPIVSSSLGLSSPELALIFATAHGCCCFHGEPLPGPIDSNTGTNAPGSRRSLLGSSSSSSSLSTPSIIGSGDVAGRDNDGTARASSPDSSSKGQGMSTQIERILRPLFKAVGAGFVAGLGSSLSMSSDDAEYLGPEDLRLVTLGRSNSNMPAHQVPPSNIRDPDGSSKESKPTPSSNKPTIIPLPRLQFAFVEWLGQMLDDPAEHEIRFRARGWCLKWMDICKLWELLFSSPWFYLWAEEHGATHAVYATKLRQCVMQFVEYVATLPDFDNQHPCRALITLIERYYPSQPDIIHQACQSLRFILTHKRQITQESMRRIEALSVMTPLLSKATSNPEPMGMQFSILSVFDSMLVGDRDMAIYFYADRPTLKLLFKLAVGSSRTISQSSLARILDLIAVVPLEYPKYGIGGRCPPYSGPPSPSGPEVGGDTGADLLGYFFVCFPPEIATNRQLELQCSLLGGIRTLLIRYSNNPVKLNSMKATLLSSQVFEHCLGVLSSRVPSEMGEEAFHRLAIEVIKTIAFILRDSKEAKRDFRNLVGFEEMRIRLFVKGSWAAWDGLLDGLMGLVLDSSDGFEAVVENPIVRNSDAARSLFVFYPHLGSELQVSFLSRLTRLASSHEMNRVILCEAGAAARLVKEVIPKSTNSEALERAIELLEVLGTHNIRVAETRLMLASLRPQSSAVTIPRAARQRKPSNLITSGGVSSEVLPFYYDHMLAAMVNIAQRREYDLESFYFSGQRSGLVLPPFEKWPSNNGYTFITWFKLEAKGWGEEKNDVHTLPISPPMSPESRNKGLFKSRHKAKKSDAKRPTSSRRDLSTTNESGAFLSIPSPIAENITNPPTSPTPPDESPRIFSFLTPAGGGAELYVSNGTIKYAVTSRNGHSSRIELGGVKILNNRWYFIAVCHPAPKRPWTAQSEVLVYMNGAIRHKEKMDFPDSDLHAMCRVGASARLPGFDTPDVLPSACHYSLPGQMSSICILDEALSVEKLNSIYNLGIARYSSSLENIAISLEKETKASDSKNWGKFLIVLHPSSALRPTCSSSHDDSVNSPGIDDNDDNDGSLSVYDLIRSTALAEPSEPAKLRSGIICSSRSMRTALRALGAPEILLPIFSHLELVTLNVLLETESVRENLQTKRACRGFSLIAVTLDGDKTSIDKFTSNKTAKTISLLLQARSSKFISMTLLDAIMNVVKVITSVEPEPMVDTLNALVFEPRLWSVANVRTQNDLLHFLQHYAHGPERRLCRARFGVGHFVEWIDRFYAYGPSPPPAPDYRPSIAEMQQLRNIIWNICTDYLSQGATSDEVCKIMAPLWECSNDRDPQHMLEVFAVIVKAAAEPGSGVAEMFLANHGIECMVNLLRTDQCEGLRVMVLDFVLALIRFRPGVDKWKKRLRFEDIGGIGRIVERHAVSMVLYRSLLRLVIEESLTRGSEILDLEFINAPVLRNPIVLYSIWELASKAPCIEEGVKTQILRDSIALAKAIKSNAERIRCRPGWQIAVLSMVTNRSLGDQGSTGLSMLLELAEELISVGILDSFDTERKGWRFVEETVTLLWATRRADGLILIRRVIGRLLRDICAQIRTSPNLAMNIGTIKMENILHLLYLTEDIMFHHRGFHDALTQEMGPPDSPGSDKFQRSISYSSLSLSDPDISVPGEAGERVNVKEMIDQEAQPMHETAELVKDYLDLLTALIEGGMPIVGSLVDGGDKATKQRTVDVVKLALRVLLSGLISPDDEACNLAIPHLIPILERHGVLFADVESRAKLLSVLCQMHEAFLQAMNRTQGPAGVKVILPAYMLMVNRWRHILLTLKDDNLCPILSESVLSTAEANQEVFLEVLQSPAWTLMYEKHFKPATTAVNEDLATVLPAALKRHAKMARLAVGRARKEDAITDNRREQLLTTVDIMARKRRDEEMLVASDHLNVIDTERRSILRQWAALSRALSSERGVWAALETTVHWKLDASENSSRMRRKLSPNLDYDDHLDGAARRDKVTVDSPRSRNSSRKPSARLLTTSSAVDMLSNTPAILSTTVNGPGEEPVNSFINGEDEEGWSIINDDNVSVASTIAGWIGGERTACDVIAMMSAVKGRLEITTTHIYFQIEAKSTFDLVEEAQKYLDQELVRDRVWSVASVREIYPRRYLLRKSAIEIFFTDRTSCFFNFRSTRDRSRVLSRIIALRPPSLLTPDARTPSEILRRSGYTERWQRHEISNFDYLMHLNTISGRTYNDLTQYPIFPWILQDYESQTLNLSDPSIYRDLSKPIGALDDARLQNILERYRAFEDPSGRIKKFMYGTHYSSAAATLFYLLRLEPFTTLHILLQGGKFDHPDRQFHSIHSCWKSVSTGSGDVKELIPEFFYMPEFLVNENKFDLGVKQTGEAVDDVILPPWASSPQEFIRIHREALEGDYVSQRLHEWIDLIWGYKQTGEEAVKAHNVFFYTTYEGAIDIESIRDPIERQSLEDQINNFGQTPSQLLKRPHPKRLPVTSPLVFEWSLFSHPQSHKSYLIQLKSEGISGVSLCEEPLSTNVMASAAGQLVEKVVSGKSLKLVTICNDGTYGFQKWAAAMNREDVPPFTYEPDTPGAKRQLPYQCNRRNGFKGNISNQLFEFSRDGSFMFVGGHWSGSIQIISVDSGSRVGESVPAHRDVVTCLAMSADGDVLVAGSKDSTVSTWNVVTQSGGMRSISEAVERMRDSVPIRIGGQQILHGHDDEVTAVAVDVEHDLVVSGSKDGSCIYYSLHGGRYFRSVRPSTNFKEDAVIVRRVLVTKQAAVLVYSETQTRDISFIHTYSINGKLLKDRMFTWQMNDLGSSADGSCVVAADNKGGVSLMKPYNLQIIHRFDVSVNVLSVAVSNNAQFLFLGRVDGRLLIIALDVKGVRNQIAASAQVAASAHSSSSSL
ncbi:hypothetical protein SeMB42_g04580 [Synchytrium endobioticum]|uniref:Beige protein homolog 1 n=1 Tax=Synchytrium endobioticum TaxID=286115 RepID=A0A507CX69_9FUNG|nr:hypothetical protein SeMB42_g04580 [Synchytrium endobioticum]TPX48512.1 hypothetical protein SeLEV6574_g02003 [Synchytrium endobioticum]